MYLESDVPVDPASHPPVENLSDDSYSDPPIGGHTGEQHIDGSIKEPEEETKGEQLTEDSQEPSEENSEESVGILGQISGG